MTAVTTNVALPVHIDARHPLTPAAIEGTIVTTSFPFADARVEVLSPGKVVITTGILAVEARPQPL